MNKLEGSITYLAGPIDFADDQGKGFRAEIVEKGKDLGIKFLDPCSKLCGLAKEVDEEQEKIHEYKRIGNYVDLQNMMKPIVRGDLRMIDYSDFIIAYIDTDVFMCGTMHEIVVSLNQHKPTLIVVKGGLQNAPSWLFGICKLEHMFDSIDDMIVYLKRINCGDIPAGPEWILIRKELEGYQNI